MNSLNSILVEGSVVDVPALTTTPKGSSVSSFRIRSSRFFRVDGEWTEEISFFSIEAWGRLAEFTEKGISTDNTVRVVGRLKQDRWTDASGAEHSRVKIVAEHIELKRSIASDDSGDPEHDPV